MSTYSWDVMILTSTLWAHRILFCFIFCPVRQETYSNLSYITFPWLYWYRVVCLSQSVIFSGNVNLELGVLTLCLKRWHILINPRDIDGTIFLPLFWKIACLKIKKWSRPVIRNHMKDTMNWCFNFTYFWNPDASLSLSSLKNFCILLKMFLFLLKLVKVWFPLLWIQNFLIITADKIWLFKP